MGFKNIQDRKEHDQAYYLANKEKIKARQREYSKNHRNESKVYREKNKLKTKKYRENHSLESKQYQKEYYFKNKTKIDKRNKKYTLNNKEKIKEYRKGYNLKNKKKSQQQSADWRKANPEKVKAISSRFRDKHREKLKAYNRQRQPKVREYRRNRRKNNPKVRFITNMRRRVLLALKGKNKSSKTIELLGASLEVVIKHIESKFLPGMTWENYGRDTWHIDHIKSVCQFENLEDPAQQKACFHYTNLQPLWAQDNLKKKKYFQNLEI